MVKFKKKNMLISPFKVLEYPWLVGLANDDGSKLQKNLDMERNILLAGSNLYRLFIIRPICLCHIQTFLTLLTYQ